MKPKGISSNTVVNNIIRFVRRIFVGILVIPIKIYQYVISPYTPSSCRHIPTCSNYAIEALRVHGIFKGLYLAFKRIIRCHPWGTHGYDPVPPPGKWKIKK